MGSLRLTDYIDKKSTYICHFIAYTDTAHRKTGCLLHPQGSPHPDILYWKYPQNFSFYGSTICQGYNCISKEKGLGNTFSLDINLSNEDLFIYGMLISNHNIHRICKKIFAQCNYSIQDIYKGIIRSKKEYENLLTTTSFEELLKIEDVNQLDDLFNPLGTILCGNLVTQSIFKVTNHGESLGRKLQNSFLF